MGGGGGGGSGGPFKSAPARDIADKLLGSSQDNLEAAFGAELASLMDELLANYNSRDAALVQRRVEEILAAIGRHIEGEVIPLFGGSVAKRTHVEGLSDVDTLLRLDATELSDKTPQGALGALWKAIAERLTGRVSDVKKGVLAVTVTYADGMEIQLLPALTTTGGLRIPAWRGNSWSDIDPEAFARALTKANKDAGGRLIPTIKLVKAINATLPEDHQLSGYHIESMGIAAFRDYSGDRTLPRMVMHYFDRARELVLRPMADRTGQSVHVDEHLGAANSPARKQLRHLLDRIHRRMQTASALQSLDQWKLLLDA